MKKTGVVSEVYPKMAAVLIDGELAPGESRQKVLCTYRRAQVLDRQGADQAGKDVCTGDDSTALGSAGEATQDTAKIKSKGPAKDRGGAHSGGSYKREKHSHSHSGRGPSRNSKQGRGMVGNRSQQSEESIAAEWRERSPVAPGDRVEVRLLGSRDGVIEDIYPRRNSIQRRAPGREGKILHTIAANIDQVVIVSSFDDPKFSPGLVDRFLVATTQAGITPVLVINKMDLDSQAHASTREMPWKLYQDLGVHCFPVSTKNGLGMDVLETFLRHKVSVFCGHSGVGKTSLLHQLFGESAGRVGEISKATGKGRHTTTVSILLETPDGTRFIDTPGIKEFGLHNIDPEDLIEFFPELHEEQLARRPIEGLTRYENYLRIKRALEEEGR
jgi:ribosome biogenesis GTPase